MPEAGTHNIWVENGILYIAYYQGGLRIVDVSGELRGDLYRQGRQMGWYHTAAGEDALSDMNSGLWALHHERPGDLSP